MLASEPFARQSTVKLMTALGHIRTAIDVGDYASILNGVEAGVSSNLCEAIASMQPEGAQAHLRMSMTWSPSRPRVPKSVNSSVEFSQATFDIVREAGRKLREKVASSRQRIEGRIISLKAESTLFDEFEGIVTLKTEIDGTSVRVRIVLDSDDYKKACDAHRDGKAVCVDGLLQREAMLYHLIQPQDFQVIDNH